MRDDEVMLRALELGRAVRRLTAPNPWVGSVVVRDGTVVGEGATEPPGGPHAEIVALREAGERARGATVFTTLEPCSHHGQTGPCVDALIAAGVARVVSAIEDPDARVSGSGHAALRAAGIEVDVGVGAAEAAYLLAPYIVHRRDGRAFAVLKTATSLDGRVAAADGASHWITGDAARRRARTPRRLASRGRRFGNRARRSARAVRGVSGPLGAPPLRGSRRARSRCRDRSAVRSSSLADPCRYHRAVAGEVRRVGAGAAVEVVDPGPAGRGVDLDALLRLLGRRGVLQALVEGGPTVHGAFLDAGLVDRIIAYVAPMILGAGGRAGYGLDPGPALAAAPRYRLTRVGAVGDDVCLEYDVDRAR